MVTLSVRDVLLVQKRELEARLKEKYVERDASLRSLDSGIINVIIGPRRAGKSFFAERELSKLGEFAYVNFDDERLVKVREYDDIIEAVKSTYKNARYLLLDEIQNLEGWELFVNRLQRQGFRLVITGSNSNLLSRELATHLTGRHLQTAIFPFSFKEFLKLESGELTESEIKSKFESFVSQGGYPEPNAKKIGFADYLSTLFDSIIYKDIVKKHGVRAPKGIGDLAVYLATNASKECSYNNLSRVTQTKSVHTVKKYLAYLEEAFLFFEVPRFSFKQREQAAANKKIYCIDNGFIKAKGEKFTEDYGRLYENAVAVELKKTEFNASGTRIYYWRDRQSGAEVDFVVKRGLEIEELIQVCYDVSEEKTREREVRALLKASSELKCRSLTVLTGDHSAEEKAEWFGLKGKISFIPLWKWLLAERAENMKKKRRKRTLADLFGAAPEVGAKSFYKWKKKEAKGENRADVRG